MHHPQRRLRGAAGVYRAPFGAGYGRPMTPAEALLLALVQGVTEYLPISSSAHLILLPYVVGWRDHPLVYDVVTNAGTLLAAVVYFRRELAAAWRGTAELWRIGRRPGLLPAVAVGSLPVGACGLVFHDWLASGARSAGLIATTSIVFGVALGAADRWGERRRQLDDLRWQDAAVIGLAQALALLPGTSRSGITLTAALLLGFGGGEAARFSFLLAIPVGAMALAKDGFDLLRGAAPNPGWAALAVGFAVATLSGYLVIGWLLAWVERRSLAPFVVYRLLLGGVIAAVVLLR